MTRLSVAPVSGQCSGAVLETGERGMTETKVVVEKILSSQNQNSASEVLKKPRSVKAQKTAAKVQLMKLKMKSSQPELKLAPGRVSNLSISWQVLNKQGSDLR